MRIATVQLSELAQRRSWSALDFLYAVGDRVEVTGVGPVIVARQEGRTVWVATVEHVAGSRTEFCCSLPRPVSVFEIELRRWPR